MAASLSSMSPCCCCILPTQDPQVLTACIYIPRVYHYDGLLFLHRRDWSTNEREAVV